MPNKTFWAIFTKKGKIIPEAGLYKNPQEANLAFVEEGEYTKPCRLTWDEKKEKP